MVQLVLYQCGVQGRIHIIFTHYGSLYTYFRDSSFKSLLYRLHSVSDSTQNCLRSKVTTTRTELQSDSPRRV